MSDIQASNSVVRPSIPWKIIAVVCAGTFLGPLTGGIVNVALPSIAEHFATSLQTVKWVVMSFLLVITATLPLVGRLGRWLGEGRVYALGLSLFCLGAVSCALSSHLTLGWLVLFRALQAAGSTLMVGVGPSLITLHVPPERRSLAFGVFGSVVGLALILGPPLGVVLCDTAGWPWIFWIQVPLALLALLLSRMLIKHDQRFQLAGVPLFSFFAWAGLVTGLLLLGEAVSRGLLIKLWPLTLLLTLGCLGLLVLCERRTVRLFDYALFRYAAYWRGALGLTVINMVLFTMILLLPFYFEEYLQLSTLAKGLLFVISPLVSVFIGPLAGHLADRIGFRRPVLFGLVMLCASYGLLAWSVQVHNMIILGAGLALMGLGSAAYMGPNFAAMMGSVSDAQRSHASSLGSLMRNMGFLLGTSFGPLVFALLLMRLGGHDLFTSLRQEELGPASVPIEMFSLTFSWTLVCCGVVLLLILASSVNYPNRVAPPGS